MDIKELREKQGLSQEQLAEKAGVAQSTIHYIENGNNPRTETLIKIAAALGVKPGELLDNRMDRAAGE